MVAREKAVKGKSIENGVFGIGELRR